MHRLNKKLLLIPSILLASFLIQGCGTSPTRPPNYQKLEIQENLLTKCPDLPIPTKETVGDMGKLREAHESLMYSYNDCAMGKDGLVDSIRKIQQQTKSENK